ncbi:MAG: hypothetical protein AABX70_08715 [Nanoarchaeota archaeon]
MRKVLIPLTLALTGAAISQWNHWENPSRVLEERVASPIQAPVTVNPTSEVGKFLVYDLSEEKWGRIEAKSKEERIHGKKWHYEIKREPTEDRRGYFVYLIDQKETYPAPSDSKVYAIWLKWLLQDSKVEFDLRRN